MTNVLCWREQAGEGDYRYVFWAGGVFFFGLLAFMLMAEVHSYLHRVPGSTYWSWWTVMVDW